MKNKPTRVDWGDCFGTPTSPTSAAAEARTPLAHGPKILTPRDAENYLATNPSTNEPEMPGLSSSEPIKVWLSLVDRPDSPIVLNWTGSPHGKWDWVGLGGWKDGKLYHCRHDLAYCWQWASRGSKYVTNYNVGWLEGQGYTDIHVEYIVWDERLRYYVVKSEGRWGQ